MATISTPASRDEQREQIVSALIATEGNIKCAAMRLRIPKSTFRRRMRVWGIASGFARPQRDRDAMRQAIEQHGSKAAAARALDIDLSTLNYRLSIPPVDDGVEVLDTIPASEANAMPVGPHVEEVVLYAFETATGNARERF